MEKIQEMALRFIYDDFQSSTEALLSMSNTTPLHIKGMDKVSARIGNSLPNNIRAAESSLSLFFFFFYQFKRPIHTWDGINCKCFLGSVWFCFSSVLVSQSSVSFYFLFVSVYLVLIWCAALVWFY